MSNAVAPLAEAPHRTGASGAARAGDEGGFTDRSVAPSGKSDATGGNRTGGEEICGARAGTGKENAAGLSSLSKAHGSPGDRTSSAAG